MKERPNLDDVIADIQKMIDENQRSYIRYIHVGTLMDILYLLKEQEAVPVDTKMIGMPNGTDIEVFCCPDCRIVLDESFHFCPNCGQAVKWE